MITLRRLCSIATIIAIAACKSNAPPAPPLAAEPATSSEIVGIAPKNAIVTLLPAAGPPPMPEQPAVMDQQSKQFIPNVLLVRPGQPVAFRNSEDMPHNVSVTRRGSGTEVFNVGTEPRQQHVHTFDRIGQFDVLCDIHEGMSAIVIVAPGPMTTIAEDDGRFKFAGVPFGSYKLSLTFEGQTVEQALEITSAHTQFKLSR
ncbi:MAG: plastocyanin/azurin family copper-binding protein [Vicinamibacterales bacterium]